MQKISELFEIQHKKINKKKKTDVKKRDLHTISLIKLMISQGKKRQAKKSLKDIIKLSKNSKDINSAKKILEKL